MRTNEATDFLKGLHTQGILTFDPSKGLVLTAKAAGTPLESLLQVSAEQASRIGETFDPLFDTRKRLAGLMKDGVNAEMLRQILADIEGSQVTEKETENAKEALGQLLLPGEEGQPLAGGSVPTEDNPPTDPAKASGENSADVHIREGVHGGDNPGTSRRTRGSGDTTGRSAGGSAQ